MIHKITVMSAIIASSMAINAATVNDLGELESGAEYTYSAMEPVSATFTVPKSGLLRTYASGDMIYAFTDEEHNDYLEDLEFYWGPNGTKAHVYEVKEGEKIYFHNNFPMDGGTFKIMFGDQPIEISNVYPAAGTEGLTSVSANMQIEVNFNMPVEYTKFTLEAEGQSTQLAADARNTSISANWYSTIMNWYRSGVLKEGSELTVTITGVRDKYNSNNRPNFGDGAGKVVLKYKMAAKPAEVTMEIGTPMTGTYDFLSYWSPESEAGQVILGFDRDLDPACEPEVVIEYGDRESENFDLYLENPPYTIEGGTITVDLRGKSRLSQEMVPGLAKLSFINLRITGILSVDGQRVWTGNEMSPTSYSYSYNYVELAYNISSDWTPAIGRSINAGEEMEIWVMNGDQIAFDSIDFAYTSNGEAVVASVPYAEVKAEADPDVAGAMLYYLTVPAMTPDADTDITVTFGGLAVTDGQDHSADLTATYKAGTSGVAGIEETGNSGETYDLQGRRVKEGELAPGLYIRDGKKIMITL